MSDASSADPKGLSWTKVALEGLNNGVWGVDTMVSGGGWWYFTLPSCIAPGDYLMRAELIGKFPLISRSLIGHTDTNSPPLRLQRRRRAVLHVLRKHPRHWQRIHSALWRRQPSRRLLIWRPVSFNFLALSPGCPLYPAAPALPNTVFEYDLELC